MSKAEKWKAGLHLLYRDGIKHIPKGRKFDELLLKAAEENGPNDSTGYINIDGEKIPFLVVWSDWPYDEEKEY